MDQARLRPERLELAPGLTISRIVTGLWQVADMERDGKTLDPEAAATALAAYAEAGFDAFDMADHYGSAEVIAGRLLAKARAGDVAVADGRRPVAFTKWCPPPGDMTAAVVRAGIARAGERLGVDTIDLLQLHWWMYEHPGYLDAMAELTALRDEGAIAHLGLTNFNTDHLCVLVGQGFEVLTNQVSFSLLDRRAAGAMTAFCRAHGIRLLAYGTLGGGFLSERWLGHAAPADIADWSKQKYRRFVDAIGGWDVLQAVLAALARVADRHGVSIANVATRWVLEQPAVAAVIVGARPGEREHRADNVRAFAFALDAADHGLIDAALADARDLPGDCGDEYRRPPFLTASGDLSHHLDSLPKAYPTVERNGRRRVDTGSVWEAACGFAPCASAIGSWSAARRRPTARARRSARATCGARPSTSSTRSPPASPRSAEPATTSSAPASICATPLGGRPWPVCTAAISPTPGRPTRSSRCPGWSAITRSRSRPRRSCGTRRSRAHGRDRR